MCKDVRDVLFAGFTTILTKHLILMATSSKVFKKFMSITQRASRQYHSGVIWCEHSDCEMLYLARLKPHLTQFVSAHCAVKQLSLIAYNPSPDVDKTCTVGSPGCMHIGVISSMPTCHHEMYASNCRFCSCQALHNHRHAAHPLRPHSMHLFPRPLCLCAIHAFMPVPPA